MKIIFQNAVNKTLIMLLCTFFVYSCKNDGGIWLGEGESSGKSYVFGDNKDIDNIQGLAKAYSEQDTETLFEYYNKEVFNEKWQNWTSGYLESMESISMVPYKIIPLHVKNGDFKQVLAWSKEERVYKNGSYEMLDLMEQFVIDDAGKVKDFKQWKAIDSVNFGMSYGGKYFGREKGEYSGRSFMFSNRNETDLIEKLVDSYNKMDTEVMKTVFADEFTLNDFKGNKSTMKQDDFKNFFSPYKKVDWNVISIIPIKIRGTDAASGVIVYGTESRVMQNGEKWNKDLMEIVYFNLEGKISSVEQFAKPKQ
jgi:hypothetical protein